MNDLLNKIVDYVLKAIPTLLLSGTGYQFLDGRWYGQMIFGAYLGQRSVTLLTPPLSDDVYAALGTQSLTESIARISALRLLLTIAFMLALLAHVLFKSNIAAREAAAAGSGAARHGWRARIAALYQFHYYAITIAIFGVLLSLFMLVQLRLALVVLLGLIAAPAALYLVLYSKDTVAGSFTEKFVWLSLLIVLIVVLAGWPNLYGRRLFDPYFNAVSIAASAPDHCNAESLGKGPIFVANGKDAKETFFRLCFRPPADRYVDFFSYDGAHTLTGRTRLSDAIEAFVPPPAVPGTLEALREQLAKQGHP